MPSPVKDMQVDRRCFQAFMSEEVLYSSNIVAVLQQMSGKRVAERMRCYSFFDIQSSCGSVQCYSDIFS